MAKQVRADDFIRQLSNGYETVLNEDSDNISHGQKQLLTIARTILADKEILILDEATSSLDSNTQSQINEAIKVLSQKNPELTIVVIAHRASALDYCDYIVNM